MVLAEAVTRCNSQGKQGNREEEGRGGKEGRGSGEGAPDGRVRDALQNSPGSLALIRTIIDLSLRARGERRNWVDAATCSFRRSAGRPAYRERIG
jgi:hypothetical protein